MAITDKSGVLSSAHARAGLVLELGCGSRKRYAGAIGIDARDDVCVDVVGDVFEVLRSLPDVSVQTIYAHHFMEHIEDLNSLMNEIARVLSTGGRLEVVVPHFSNPYFYSDWTHKRIFGLYTFSYFADDALFRRATPRYEKECKFELVDVKYGFKSWRPNYIRHGLKAAVGRLLTMNRYLMEFYEENLCYLWPCYEIKFEMRRI